MPAEVEWKDGVPCKPGDFVISDEGQAFICDSTLKYVPAPGSTIPNCGPGDILVWNSQLNTFECIVQESKAEMTFDGTGRVGDEHFDPLWIIFWLAVVFVLGSLGVGLTQWWRNRKAKQEVNLEVWSKLGVSQIDDMRLGGEFKQPGPMTTCIPGTNTHINCQHKETLVMPEPIDKNPNSLQDEIKEIYSLIQLARNDVNKIPGFLQVSVNSAMDNLNKARDRVAALGGKVK